MTAPLDGIRGLEDELKAAGVHFVSFGPRDDQWQVNCRSKQGSGWTVGEPQPSLELAIRDCLKRFTRRWETPPPDAEQPDFFLATTAPDPLMDLLG